MHEMIYNTHMHQIWFGGETDEEYEEFYVAAFLSHPKNKKKKIQKISNLLTHHLMVLEAIDKYQLEVDIMNAVQLINISRNTQVIYTNIYTYEQNCSIAASVYIVQWMRYRKSTALSVIHSLTLCIPIRKSTKSHMKRKEKKKGIDRWKVHTQKTSEWKE